MDATAANPDCDPLKRSVEENVTKKIGAGYLYSKKLIHCAVTFLSEPMRLFDAVDEFIARSAFVHCWGCMCS
jgi:hypothetical protein